MELEFDKEMDALLRKAGRSGVLVGDTPKLHLDADALAAFAENSLPEKSRRIYTEHLAECDPCRKTLSAFVMLNAEAEPERAPVVAPLIASNPWYRKLFTTPNLAYTFGGLILLFGGLIGFVAFQGMRSGDVAVSQLQETDTSRSAAPAQPLAASANSNSVANAANTTSNTTGEIPNAVGSTDAVTETEADKPVAAPPPAPLVASSPAGADTGFASTTTPSKPVTMDGLAGTPMQPAPKEVAKSADEERKMRVEDKRTLSEQEARKQDLEANTIQNRQMNQNQVQMTPGAGNAKDSGPNRANVQRDNRAYDDDTSMKAKKAESPSSGARPDTTSGRKQAGGKTFELKQGAWYDTAYRGQSTKNVRRGSDDYRKLDGGLRSIADSVGGTVVVVWSGKAYRIQ